MLDPKTGYDLLNQGNLDVFDDIYPQLLAYRDGDGIVAIRRMFADGQIDDAQLDAWENIARGRQTNNPDLVWIGNQGLQRFEQESTLQ